MGAGDERQRWEMSEQLTKCPWCGSELTIEEPMVSPGMPMYYCDECKSYMIVSKVEYAGKGKPFICEDDIAVIESE